MNRLDGVRSSWNHYAETNPMGSVLTGDEWDEERFYETGKANIERLMGLLTEFAPNLDRQSALDFGCGLGRLTFSLARHFDRVTGIDISTKMISLAETNPRMPANVSLKLNTRPDLSQLNSNEFDLVLSLIVLQHMPLKYMKVYLAEFLRVAKPKGVVVFQIPDRIQVEHKLWEDKPLRSDSPSIWRLCYRSVFRFLRWIPRRIKFSYIHNSIWYTLRYIQSNRAGEPIMEMNAWKRKSIERFIKKRGGRILHVEQDPNTPEELESYTFVIEKTGAP